MFEWRWFAGNGGLIDRGRRFALLASRLSLFAALILGASCTLQDRYESVRRGELDECQRQVTERLQEECRERLRQAMPESYREYERQRRQLP